ncbi:type IV secretion system protein VirB10 [Methylibium rhizosphaerae]|uniref:type IV secretion system protein VirB10 n=1 Tax=Methylibium rhizosphaerae TaxID=2570323 RepID=UPI001FEA7CE8|nr:type IV secretion system protein VirB10 [Methylibium rhizosphaerae]
MRIPALIPTEEEVEPIGVRRTGSGRGKGRAPAEKPYDPRDDPVMIISSPPEPLPDDNAPAASGQLGSRKLDPVETALRHPAKDMDAYQRQLQAALDHLTRTATTAANNATAATGRTPPPPVAGQAPQGTVEGPDGAQITPPLFGGELQATHTPPIKARLMPNRSLTMPKGTAFTCALKTKVISGASGMVGCMVQRDIYGDDGKVLLVERGSHMDGEYRSVSVRPGMVRLPVMWTRIRTPHGVLVELNSPGTGQLGEAGIDGYVDNRWPERLGAAMLLSMIDDAVQLVIENQKEDTQGDTIVLPGTTANSSRLAEKVLDSTINIPPVMYQNQGGIVGVYVARDIDFSAVYRLKLTPLSTAASGVDLNAEQK